MKTEPYIQRYGRGTTPPAPKCADLLEIERLTEEGKVAIAAGDKEKALALFTQARDLGDKAIERRLLIDDYWPKPSENLSFDYVELLPRQVLAARPQRLHPPHRLARVAPFPWRGFAVFVAIVAIAAALFTLSR